MIAIHSTLSIIYDLLSLLIPAFGLLISLLTLYLGFLAYKKFLNKSLKKSQLELVLQLIDSFHKSEILLTIVQFVDERPLTGLYSQNIFQLADGGNVNTESNYKIYETVGNNWVFPPFEFLNNPILPSDISYMLMNLYKGFEFINNQPSQNETFFVIGHHKESVFNEPSMLRQYKGGLYGFLNDIIRINKALRKWLDDNVVTDLNETILKKKFDMFG